MILADSFPHLQSEGFTETSPATSAYNCIAWAAGETDRWWWPDRFDVGYWPGSVPRTESLEAFFQVFESLGYTRCENGDLETGYEKVALYVQDDKPTHAARQLPDGRWTSKLGKEFDITHTLRGLEGPVYGRVAGFLKRPRP
ncbi:MAG: hypothetical protein NZM31_03615 [Gemmatales bacterium]|nr:hypothetical protein [Gemmatales bacterium]MDW8386087.1 hypothetical protein [Gemmatales bacterium]